MFALGKELSAERRLRKIFSDARRCPRVIDQQHAVVADVKLALQRADELRDSAELNLRRDRMIEIADEANADAGGIDLACAGGGEGELLLVPALADLDFAVFAAVAVADDEMIA